MTFEFTLRCNIFMLDSNFSMFYGAKLYLTCWRELKLIRCTNRFKRKPDNLTLGIFETRYTHSLSSQKHDFEIRVIK